MKKKSFVEWMTSFISNMRVERVKETKEEIGLVAWFNKNIVAFKFVESFDGTEAGSKVGQIQFFKKDATIFNANEDLTESLKQEFVESLPIHFSIKKFEVDGDVNYSDVHWDIDLDWNIESGTLSQVIYVIDGESGTPTQVAGTCSCVTGKGARVEGLDALIEFSPDLQFAINISSEFTIKDTPILLYTNISEDIEPEEGKVVYMTIEKDEVVTSYPFEYGMSWTNWCASAYNTLGLEATRHAVTLDNYDLKDSVGENAGGNLPILYLEEYKLVDRK